MFVYGNWEKFCKILSERNIHSITAQEELELKKGEFLILKHDVETDPKKALELAKIEAKYGHRGVYYAQAVLLNEKNAEIFKEIQSLGHEVSYHHDVMDSNSGDIDKAIDDFSLKKANFEKYGFKIRTVCQHGNPVAERRGYHSNRDFFRNEKVKGKFQDIYEIMVDYKQEIGVEYKYISDAGYGWKLIFDPETNDLVNSDDKNVKLGTLNNVIDIIEKEKAVIVSTHPHRWNSNIFSAWCKNLIFKTVRIGARIAYKIPGLKKIMEKFYFLAKKI